MSHRPYEATTADEMQSWSAAMRHAEDLRDRDDWQDTLTSYADDEQESYDALLARMQEAYTHLQTAAAALDAGLQATAGPINHSPFADLSLARAHLAFALTAWD